MPSNDYYDHTTYPGPNAPGSSAALRAELDSIEQGFLKLPTLTGNGNKVVVINAGGTALTSTLSLSGLTLNSTTIGATTPASGSFTTLLASGAVNLGSSVTIAGGTINGTQIGNTTPSSGAFTTLSVSSGFTGNVTGNVTGNLTGNVTASSGTSTFNNVTVNGTLDMASATVGTISGLQTPSASDDAANKGYVDTQRDTRLALAGGTMSGAIAMGSNKITGLGTPTSSADATTKTYVDTQDALRLALAGGTMSGAIAMGTNAITGMADPTNAQDAATKNYVDGIFGSATSAAASASAPATSATNAANSATTASGHASSAATSANDAAASYDAFDDRYLGAKASDPTLDNDGNALLTGAIYWNTTSSIMKVWTGSAWIATYLPASGYLALAGGTMTGAITFAGGQTWPTFNQNTTGTAANVTGTVAAANGGTGQASYAVGDLLFASTTTALSKLADVATGNALISGGVGVAPSYGKIGLTTHVTGTLPLTNGGTGLATVPALSIPVANTLNTLSALSATAGQSLRINAGGTAWEAYTPSSGSGDVTGPASSVSANIATFNGITGKVIQDGGKELPTGAVVGTTDTQTLTNKTLTNPALGNSNLTGIKNATFNSQTTIATTSGSITVDWTSAQNQLQTEPTGTITYTFTAPPGPCHLQLIINSDGTSTAQTINWPGTVIQYGATWAGANNKRSVINFWYDGTNYHMIGTNQV